VLVRNGQSVDKGAPLLRLVSPRLEFDLQQARSRLAEFQGKLNQTAIDTERLEERLVLEQAVQRAASEIQALERTIDALLIRSPSNGLVIDMNSEVHPGRWLSREHHLLTVRGGKQAHYIAWATEEQLSGLSLDEQAVFFAPANISMRAYPVRIIKIERSAVSELQPYHASVYGGDIPVDADQSGRLIPRQAIYRVHLAADSSAADWLPEQRLRGHVSIEGRSRTLVGMLFKVIVGTLIRESGF
jgi:putative peptide zinc metalloprotease protein